jgi:hypothetical protein
MEYRDVRPYLWSATRLEDTSQRPSSILAPPGGSGSLTVDMAAWITSHACI